MNKLVMSGGRSSRRRVYRWAFDCARWEPLKDEFALAFSAIQSEEKTRILRFVFKEDVKRALIGRLLIRKCVLEELDHRHWREEEVDRWRRRQSGDLEEAMTKSGVEKTGDGVVESTRLRNCDLVLGRTAKGRPKVVAPSSPETRLRAFDFNISHQGDFAVLAAVSDDVDDDDGKCLKSGVEYDEDAAADAAAFLPRVGVDVMKVESPRSKSADDFFRLMRRQLTADEWRRVEEARGNEEEQLKRFYRFWCLKESYVKALGAGIGFEVGRLGFRVKEDLESRPVHSTTVSVDGKPEVGWHFEESLLDANHCVAVATQVKSDVDSNGGRNLDTIASSSSSTPFQFLTIDQVLENLKCSSLDDDDDYDDDLLDEGWKNFNNKSTKA